MPVFFKRTFFSFSLIAFCTVSFRIESSSSDVEKGLLGTSIADIPKRLELRRDDLPYGDLGFFGDYGCLDLDCFDYFDDGISFGFYGVNESLKSMSSFTFFDICLYL